MAEAMASVQQDVVRQIHPTWNAGLIAASVAVSLLGAFTSTQLMCQARVSRHTFATVVWTMLASLTFGFCSIWSLHFVAMLACQLDVRIGLNVPLTILSAFLAVSFTFTALSSDMIWERYQRQQRARGRTKLRDHEHVSGRLRSVTPTARDSTELLLEETHHSDTEHEPRITFSPLKTKDVQVEVNVNVNGRAHEFRNSMVTPYTDTPELRFDNSEVPVASSPIRQAYDPQNYRRFSLDSERDDTDRSERSSNSGSRRGSKFSDSDASFGLGHLAGFRIKESAVAGMNIFEASAILLWKGLTRRYLAKGFVWSLAITLMHYLGIMSMEIPEGYFVLQPALVVLSALISWIVCTVGCILMASMETRIGQQLLFSVVASCGVAAMHYTGMAATTFFSALPPFTVRGYPTSLPVAIASIAVTTCLAANGLLAHSATVARNKLAEIVRTRRKLWAAIAQKENAEAAAIARSEFIASASHEIRTPLHQLQGYSDLMARCSLPEDARLLLFAIQDATKTLSLITNNVLDWSRLEKGEAICRPVDLDLRSACDSIVKLLPRRDDDLDVELLVVVSPDVPQSLLLDETYLHRIMMNLVSNSLKFTTSGYILLMLEFKDGFLIITVIDTGVGIPTSFLPDLFEPFKQAQTRGAERGTGLGLSIVKQLLEKIDGNIQTESKHRELEGVGPTKCGTKFVVRIPAKEPDTSAVVDDEFQAPKQRQKLAFFEASQSRILEGFRIAWDKFGVDVFPAKSISDITDDTKYACVDIKQLQRSESLKHALSSRDDVTVLVPYDTDNVLFSVLGSFAPSNFVPVRRPWMLHSIMQLMLDSHLRPSKVDYHRTVRFASEVDLLSMGASEQGSVPPSETPSQPSSPELLSGENPSPQDQASSRFQVLLVEDNKINQKLGAKMLKTLGYEVLLAADGQEAIDILLANQHSIDIVLMDQSMPVKDGLTATREIREMEQSSTISGASKWRNHSKRRNRRPIIAVTAVVGPSHEAMCKTVGTDAFLSKPLSLNRLRETLEEYVKESILP